MYATRGLGVVFAVMALSSNSAYGQAALSVVHDGRTYAPFSDGEGTVRPVAAYGFFDAGDEGVASIPLPFDFRWYGRTYRTLYAFTNGFVGFRPVPFGTGLLRPSLTVPNPGDDIDAFIAPAWADWIRDSVDGNIQSKVEGPVGARVVVVQYDGFVLTSNPSGSGLQFQVRLFEGTNAVEIHYGPVFGIVSGTAALENEGGTDGLNLMAPSPTCGAACACLPGQCGGLQWSLGRTITIASPPGIDVLGEVTGPPGANPAETFDVVVSVHNSGLTISGPFSVEPLLVPNPPSLTGALSLGVFGSFDVGPQSIMTSTLSVTVPPAASLGPYTWALRVDPADSVMEVDEVNNLAFGAMFGVGPDLVGEVSGPPTTGAGESVELSVMLESRGSRVSSPFDVTFFLSPTPGNDPMAALLGTRTFALPDGFSLTTNESFTVPENLSRRPTGYYVVGQIDEANGVDETDETNNVMVSVAPIPVLEPDLRATSLSSPPVGMRGQPYPITVEIENTGPATARDFSVCFDIDGQTELVAAPVTLAPNDTTILTGRPVIGAATQDTAEVAVRLDCDADVVEENETNNRIAAMTPIMIRDAGPDFALIRIDAESSYTVGEPAVVRVTVANLGTAAGSTMVRVVLSPDGMVDPTDLALSESSVASLAPGQVRIVDVPVTLATSVVPGAYFVGAWVDAQDDFDEPDEANNQAAGPISVTARLRIEGAVLPPGIVNVPFVHRFGASGGVSDRTWTLTWPDGPPAGMSFDPAQAELSGTPAVPGRYAYVIRLMVGTDVVERVGTWRADPPTIPLQVVSTRLPPGVREARYEARLTAVGGVSPYRWRIMGLLPPGMVVSEDGRVSGFAVASGAFILPMTVTDAEGAEASRDVIFNVIDPSAVVRITTADVPNGIAEEPYEMIFEATGGRPPYTWRLESRIPGLVWNESMARLTGTPTVTGTYPFLVSVQDADGEADENAYVLEILEPGRLEIVTDSMLPEGQTNVPYTTEEGGPVVLQAEPSEGVMWSVVSGALPPGLTLSPDGRVTGTPSMSGIFPFLVLATGPSGDVRQKTMLVSVDVDLNIVGAPPSDGCGCTAVASPSSPGWVFWIGVLLGAFWLRRKGCACG